MELNAAARELIGAGADATLVTINPDGSPQATVVWVALQSTPEGDELVSAHLSDTYRKVRNVRRDGNESIKKAMKDKKITEDEEKRALDEIQRLTDDEIKKIEEMSKTKEKEVMQV